MKKDPKILLGDILFSIERIERLTNGISEEIFKNDIDKQDAALRRLAIIGEAANNLPEELQDKHSEIKWREWIGMRNVLIHEYFDLKIETIWNTIVEELPILKREIKKMFK